MTHVPLISALAEPPGLWVLRQEVAGIRCLAGANQGSGCPSCDPNMGRRCEIDNIDSGPKHVRRVVDVKRPTRTWCSPVR